LIDFGIDAARTANQLAHSMVVRSDEAALTVDIPGL
jgi:hypothetical protein